MPRIYLEEGLYYIVARANYGGSLFKDDADCQQYLELLGRYKEQHQFKLFAYHLAHNSVTLLIQTAPDITISDIMRDLSSNYTKYFNGRYDKRGHLFQGRFKDILVEKDDYLVELTRYIHFSPVLQNLVKKAENYKWSSYPLYLGLVKQYGLPLDVDRAEVLQNFSSDEKKYKEFVESTRITDMQIMKKKLQSAQMLGSKQFINEVREKSKELVKKEEPVEKVSRQKMFIMAGSAAVVILGIITLYSYRVNIKFRQSFTGVLQEKEVEFKEQLSQQREIARKDLEEKYRADTVSFRAMSKRLEIERGKTKELEDKLKVIK